MFEPHPARQLPPIALYSAILPPITADGRNVTKSNTHRR